MKFRMKAKTAVTRNQSSLFRKYLRYPFKAQTSFFFEKSHVPSKQGGTWLYFIEASDYLLTRVRL
jgi:hypothetical protein